ncbi:MAG: PVC-type heme-binding CxxCH protein [Bacteroidota bacterium]
MQEVDPRSPEAESDSFRLADPDLRISLVASEPNILSPVDISWGPDGELYVAEMTGYPVTPGKGAVKQLTDPDGDGFYDQMTVFADGFDFPSSVMYFREGLLIADAPNIFHLRDEDGDGVADTKEVYLTGFNKSNEQYLVNSLHWGLDNWIYGASGRSGGAVKFAGGEAETSVDNRDFRFHPIKEEVEAVTGRSQFGLARDDWGHRFTTLNHRFARQVMLEEQHLARNPSLSTSAVFDTYQSEHDRKVFGLLKGTLRFNRDPVGYFTSLSGLTVNRGHLMGPDYHGDFFAGESVQAAVIHRRMETNGPVFQAHNTVQGAEFLASTDGWFHPVNFSNGPDGAFYVVDFYRRFVEHPEWVHNRNGEGVDWNEGEKHGRIWRVAHKDAAREPQRMQPDLSRASADELVSQLGDPAGWRRDMAQQLLIEQQDKSALAPLEEMLGHHSAVGRGHALWTLHGLGLLTEGHIQTALEDPEAMIKVQGIQLVEDLGKSEALMEQMKSLAMDENGMIRYHALLAAGSSQDAQEVFLRSAATYSDQWTRVAMLSGSAPWASTFARQLLQTPAGEIGSRDLAFFRRIGESVASTADPKAAWINSLLSGSTPVGLRAISFLNGYLGAMRDLGAEHQAPGTPLVSQLLDFAQDQSAGTSEMAVELLQYSDSKAAREGLMAIATGSSNSEARMTAVTALSGLDEPMHAQALFENVSSMDPIVRKALIAGSLRSGAATGALLSSIRDESISLTEIPEEVRRALLAHEDFETKELANDLLGAAVDSDRQAIIDRYLAVLDEQTVDLAHGAKVFSTNCTTCHAVNGIGGLLGPDLTNIGSRSDDVLLTSILDPGRMVSYELKLRIITTKSGQVYAGTVSAESATSLTVRSADGSEKTLLKSNIEQDTWTEQSIMPEGYERIINEQDMASLIGFLREPSAVIPESLR